ncbi:hypothetical protein BGW36DRAFT_298738 [Talaromyces proteolyticus]|uniref:Conserved oligomeric Golgi complex subunit 1 n=1 Tax=Talaromyces proteolyticus TaxID=1131652 RepID=A0AAD4PUH3_9EURO|nr:uncharacterized protein BGW36DRAFT_298738 [Talaromyces proteolyticus]KAH8695096.1 hypothetical protein BGW36DRAFT_298738 [Talaromyces proteolyticus]
MATETPDPQNLKSWKDAFQHPIPTVRKVEQELRRDIASNREKLRSLVGARYRELLETAETIVEMNTENQEVETKLAGLGLRCNADLIGKRQDYLADGNNDNNCRALAAQLALLHRCTTIIGRLLRKHKPLLLASKLVIISRQLYKALSQHANAPPFVEVLSSQLVNLQKTIRRRIERRLGSGNSSMEDIVDAMSAFRLSNSSSVLDIINRFHNFRLDSIVKQLEHRPRSREGILKALNLYIQTLQNTKTLSSRRLSDALAKLQGQPLLADHDILNLGDLDLDIFGRWVTNDVQNFTPWIKSDNFTKQSAEQLTKKWSKEAFNRFLEKSSAVLQDFDDFEDVLSLRKETLEIWLAAAPATITHSSVSVLEGIRDIFKMRLKSIIRNQANQLVSIGDTVKTHIDQWVSGDINQMQSLWDSSITSLEYSDGAVNFKKVVVNTFYGRDLKIMATLELYDSWLELIERSRSSIDDLRHTRWEDTLDEGEDDSKLEMNPIALLNEDDPHLLQEEQVNTIKQAFLELQKTFRAAAEASGDSDQSGKSAFLLRLIREVRRNSPSKILEDESLDFAQDTVPVLHEVLVNEILAHVPPSNIFPVPKKNTLRLPGRTLWDGAPELPNQPLPSTFRYFRRLVIAMENFGPDLWTPPAVKILKERLNKAVTESLSKNFERLHDYSHEKIDKEEDNEKKNSSDEESTNGTAKSNADDSKPQDVRDWKIQLALDAFYFRDALSVVSEKNDLLDSFIEKIQVDVEDGNSIVGRLQEAAHDFWKRTELLFGLLAN